METRIWHFRQNNSGGTFDVDQKKGIGVDVYIEAFNADQANDHAERIGLYFNGVEDGPDCECCGDRWDPVSDLYDIVQDEETIKSGFLHKLDGSFKEINKEDLY